MTIAHSFRWSRAVGTLTQTLILITVTLRSDKLIKRTELRDRCLSREINETLSPQVRGHLSRSCLSNLGRVPFEYAN